MQKNPATWQEKLPILFKEEILEEIDIRYGEFVSRRTNQRHEAISFIWNYQPATEDSREKTYIEIQITEATNYQIIVEDQPLEEEDSRKTCHVLRHLNKDKCERFVELRTVREVSIEWAAILLNGFNYQTVDIAPPDLNEEPVSLKCKNLTIRGTWDRKHKNLVGKWLNVFDEVSESLTIISGSTCARISQSPLILKTPHITISGFTDINHQVLTDFDGDTISVNGSVTKLISGSGLVKVLRDWINYGGDKIRDMKLVGIMEPNFAEKIREFFEATKLLNKCKIEESTNNLTFDHDYGQLRLQVETKSNSFHACIPTIEDAKKK